jgi:hypothetical protein
MVRCHYTVSIPSEMAEKFENFISNINTLSGGNHIIIENIVNSDVVATAIDIVATPKSETQ